MRRLILTVALAAGTAGLANAAEMPLTGKNCKISFVGTKPGGSHTGGFKSVKGKVAMKGSDVSTCKFSVTIDCTSMETDDRRLTNHLKSADFFDIRRYETAKFQSTKIEKTDDGYKVTGKLTMHGQTKTITFPAKLSLEGGTLKMDSKFTINRREFGIGTKFPSNRIDDKVTLTIDLDAKG